MTHEQRACGHDAGVAESDHGRSVGISLQKRSQDGDGTGSVVGSAVGTDVLGGEFFDIVLNLNSDK